METNKIVKLKPNQNQLLDLNGDVVNFRLDFQVESANRNPFKMLIVTQSTLDSGAEPEYKNVLEGYIDGDITSDKGLYDNYLMILKSDTEVECNLRFVLTQIPLNEEFQRQVAMNQEAIRQQEHQQFLIAENAKQKLREEQEQEKKVKDQERKLNEQERLKKEKEVSVKPEVQKKKEESGGINWKLIIIVVICCIGAFALWYFYSKSSTPAAVISNQLPENIIPPVVLPQIQPLQNIVDVNPSLTQNLLKETNLLSKINNIPIW